MAHQTHRIAHGLLERLQMPLLIENQSITAIRAVVALRLIAVASRAGRDPLPLLAQRFASITAAKAFIDFADMAGGYWPENFKVMCPCSRTMTHDELTIALLVDCAAAGQREVFSRVLDGLIRHDRHERLFEQAKAMVALLP